MSRSGKPFILPPLSPGGGKIAKFMFPKFSRPREYITDKSSPGTDRFFIIIVTILALFGTAMVFSASYAYAAFRYDDPGYFIRRQVVWLAVGFAVMFLSSRIKSDFYRSAAPYLYIFTVILLVLTLLIGLVGNGAQRWISLGPITIQPSEIAKMSLVLMLAKYFSDYETEALDRRNARNSFWYGTMYPCLIMGLIIILVMLQKHLSCIIILGLIGLFVIFISGVKTTYLGFFASCASVGVTCLAIFTDYTKERITVWRNPELYKLTGGWQTLQGLMAIGSGGFFGLGFGNSKLKYCYVSEPANDMIFTICCEELGFIGAVVILSLFALLIYRGFSIGVRISNTFSRICVLGLTAKTAIQTLLNVAVVTNTIPNTGISLPFFSYGGSSLVMLFLEMGMILSMSREAQIRK